MVLANFKLDKSKIRIGVDVIESQILLAMQANGYTIADGQGAMQYARSIKNEDEIALLKHGAAIVDAAFHRIAMEIRPGAKENDLQGVAEHEFFGLQYGHGIGVGLWEFPIISRAYSIEHPVEMEPGMVFALETYAGNEDGSDGVHLEDEVVVTDTGIEIITKFPTDRIIGCGMNY